MLVIPYFPANIVMKGLRTKSDPARGTFLQTKKARSEAFACGAGRSGPHATEESTQAAAEPRERSSAVMSFVTNSTAKYDTSGVP